MPIRKEVMQFVDTLMGLYKTMLNNVSQIKIERHISSYFTTVLSVHSSIDWTKIKTIRKEVHGGAIYKFYLSRNGYSRLKCCL